MALLRTVHLFSSLLLLQVPLSEPSILDSCCKALGDVCGSVVGMIMPDMDSEPAKETYDEKDKPSDETSPKNEDNDDKWFNRRDRCDEAQPDEYDTYLDQHDDKGNNCQKKQDNKNERCETDCCKDSSTKDNNECYDFYICHGSSSDNKNECCETDYCKDAYPHW